MEGTSDIMVTPKFGVGSILSVQFIIRISPVLGAGRRQTLIAVDPTPNFEVTMISEVPSKSSVVSNVEPKNLYNALLYKKILWMFDTSPVVSI